MTGDQPERSAPRRILIVEDNPLNLKLVRDVLEVHGYATLTTGSGQAALELAREYRPDLILMDIRLPDVSGMDVARRLKADAATRGIPIVAVTAFAMPGDRASIIESGCDDYIAKPIKVGEFLAVVAAHASGPRR